MDAKSSWNTSKWVSRVLRPVLNDKSKVRLRQSILEEQTLNNPAKIHPEVWNDGAFYLGYLKRSPRQEKEEEQQHE